MSSIPIQEVNQNIADIQQMIQQQPDDGFAYLKLAEATIEQGKTQDAITLYRKAILLFRKARKLSDLIQAYRDSLKIKPIQKLGIATAFAFHSSFGEAILKLAHQENKVEKAISIYQEAIDLDPTNPWLSFYLATLYSNLNKIEDTLELYNRAISLEPKLYQAHLKIGNILIDRDNWREGFKHFIKALRIKPGNYRINLLCTQWFEKFRYRLTPQQLNNKVETYKKIVDRSNPSQTDLTFSYLGLAKALVKVNRISDAIQYHQSAVYHKLKKSHPELVEDFFDRGSLKSPDFLIIGVMKCGTTALYDYTIQHPQILPAAFKETGALHQLVKESGESGISGDLIEYYFSLFPPRPENSSFLTGEASIGYFSNLNTGEIIQENFPNTKLLLIFRDPVKRAISDYQMSVRNGSERRTFEQIMNSDLDELEQVQDLEQIYEKARKKQYLRLGLYAYPLEQWMNLFPREQFLILSSEELSQDPRRVMGEVFQFLDLPESQQIQYQPKNKGSYSSNLDDKLITRLYAFYRPHNQRLEQFINRKFSWNC